MHITQRNASPVFTTKDGSTIRSLLDRTNAPVQAQSLAEATIAPGQATAAHYHPRTEEFYYVLAGTGEMRVQEDVAQVGPGDAILIPAGAVHALRNTGSGDLKILCCCAPPYSHEDTVLLES